MKCSLTCSTFGVRKVNDHHALGQDEHEREWRTYQVCTGIGSREGSEEARELHAARSERRVRMRRTREGCSGGVLDGYDWRLEAMDGW